MDIKAMASMGQKAMRQKQSEAEKVFWPLKGGRVKQFKPKLLEAVHAGRETANRLFDDATEAGLRLADAACFLVSEKGGKLANARAYTPVNQDSCDLIIARDVLNGGERPVGVIFSLLDREKKNILMHGRPFESELEPFIAAALDRAELAFRTQKEEVFA